jgi:hypothetical protein
VINVETAGSAAGSYYQTSPYKWAVDGRCGDYVWSFGHLQGLGADLRSKMIKEGYDPDQPAGETYRFDLDDPIPLDKGALVAIPQIYAEPALVTINGAEYVSGLSGGRPWVQIEFNSRSDDDGITQSFYSWLPSSLQASLSAILEASLLDTSNPRWASSVYALGGAGLDWLSRAETQLSNAESFERGQYGSFLNFFAWAENSGGCSDGGANCDSFLVTYPISKGSALYRASDYSTDVSYLAIFGKNFASAQSARLYGEVVSPSVPDPKGGTIVVKWRDHYGFTGGGFGLDLWSSVSGGSAYQPISYRLDSNAEVLRIRWGGFVDSVQAASSSAPAVPNNSESCDGETLTCHSQDFDQNIHR